MLPKAELQSKHHNPSIQDYIMTGKIFNLQCKYLIALYNIQISLSSYFFEEMGQFSVSIFPVCFIFFKLDKCQQFSFHLLRMLLLVSIIFAYTQCKWTGMHTGNNNSLIEANHQTTDLPAVYYLKSPPSNL